MSAPIEFEMTGENQFSDELTVLGNFNFSLISSSFVGIVTIQRKFPGDVAFRDIKTYTGSTEDRDFEPEGAQYRYGIKTGDYTSGTIDGRLRKTKN